MFKKGFFYIALVLVIGMNTGCSSSGDSGEDLDISEIKEIETTGEFSEDEFFSADDVETKETELVDDVAEAGEEISEGVAGLEEGLSDELEVDDVAALEGADVLDDLDSGTLDEESLIGENEDVTVSAADLGFEEDGETADILDGESQKTAEVGEDELDLESEDDLFREDDSTISDVAAAADATAEFEKDENEMSAAQKLSEDVTIDDIDYSEQIAEGGKSAAELLDEDVTIEDVDYSQQVTTSGKSASELLNEDDVSIDVDYSNVNSSTVASSPAKSYLPVRKMQTVPYSKNGVLVNAIYFVRSGDNLAKIGSKIYGNGSAVDFRIVNPHLKPGALKVGQKVYYNSPNRSQDRSRLLTYYEDVRMPAQTYSASAGENIRKISENLLGHSRSWMEVWASNQQIQEKWALSAPYQIRYWQGSKASGARLARNETPAAPKPVPVAVAPKVEPVAPKAVEVAKQEEATSQASLNLDEPGMEEEDIFDDPVVAEENGLDEPDMEMDEPAEVAGVSEDNDDIFDDIVEDEPADPVVAKNNQAPGVNGNETVAAVDGRGIARNKGGFAAKSSGFMNSAMMRQGVIGLALLLLLIVGFLVVRRRKQSQNAVEMDSFDFGGETAVEDVQEKTQIDL